MFYQRSGIRSNRGFGQSLAGRPASAALLTDEYLLVADDLSAVNRARFDWLYHQRADSLACAAAPPRQRRRWTCQRRISW